MSRIGKMPIALPAGVTVEFKDSVVTVKGPKGTLTREIVGNIGISFGVGIRYSVYHLTVSVIINFTIKLGTCVKITIGINLFVGISISGFIGGAIVVLEHA